MIGVGNAVVCRSKKDIDRHVQEQFEKLNNEHEVCNMMGVVQCLLVVLGQAVKVVGFPMDRAMRQRFPAFDRPSNDNIHF